MTKEQKLKLCLEIASYKQRIDYFKDSISKMIKEPKAFYQGNAEIRISGIRNNIWIDFSYDEALLLLKKQLKNQQKKFEDLQSKLK